MISNGMLHWLPAGLIIGFMVPLLLLIGNKSFGVSSSLRHLCTLALNDKKGYFAYDMRSNYWSLLFVLGIVLGGVIASFTSSGQVLKLGDNTKEVLSSYSLNTSPTELYPTELYSLGNSLGLVLLIIGGFLIGLGTRWANGCTSGHSIFGLANFQLSSLIATIAFFIGGLVMTHFILPIILQ